MRGEFTRHRAVRWTAAVILLSLGLFSARQCSRGDDVGLEGSVRPALDLRTLGGFVVRLPVPYPRSHVLCFFLVSCPHCRVELEHLRRLVPISGGCDLFPISLSDLKATRDLSRAGAFPFSFYVMDPDSARTLLGILRVPTLIMIDDRSRVERVLVGERSFAVDSVLMVRYCREGASGSSALNSRGEDEWPMETGVTRGGPIPHKSSLTPVSVR